MRRSYAHDLAEVFIRRIAALGELSAAGGGG